MSQFPAWAWPLLGLGAAAAWKRWRAGLAWAALGFLPLLLARDSADEPQRAILAWPALCLLAGLGAEYLPRLRWLLVLPLLGAAWEARAYQKHMAWAYDSTWGYWNNHLEAAKRLNRRGVGGVITELDHASKAPFRFLLRPEPGGATAALVPWEYARELKADWGKYERVESASSDVISPPYLVYPSPKAEARLKAIEAGLRPLWDRLYSQGPHYRRAVLLEYLDARPNADPWVRTALWEAVLQASFLAKDLPADLARRALAEPLVSASAIEWMAMLWLDSDPELALRLAKRALEMDPGREDSRNVERQAELRLKNLP